MIYLDEFYLPMNEEAAYDGRNIYNSYYPLGIFPELGIKHLGFANVTIFYGGNGVGKTTLLKIIADKLHASRKNAEKQGPLFENYVDLCDYIMTNQCDLKEIKMLSSDDVFDELLNIRAINSGVNRKKDDLTSEYLNAKYSTSKVRFDINDEDSYRRLANSVDSKRMTQSKYIRSRLANNNIKQNSNGESSMEFWEKEIQDHSLYLLDEPENSLSPKNQVKLKKYIEESTRFYGCQFIISTHSPFILAVEEARIYDLDHYGQITEWEDLDSIRTYYEFFSGNRDRFK